MILRSRIENEIPDFVMPAWIAGIQVRKDASGDLRVHLDSSTPCWNDATAGALLELTEVRPPIFSKGDTKSAKSINTKCETFVVFVNFVVRKCFVEMGVHREQRPEKFAVN